jgi:hypothetical protein
MTAPMAIAFAESMTLPPPTARMRPKPFSLHSLTPSWTKLSRGFGLTPPSSIHSTLAARSEAVTRSYKPDCLMLPPPK